MFPFPLDLKSAIKAGSKSRIVNFFTGGLCKEWRNFLLNEELDEKSIFTYIQGLQEIISNLKPRTVSEKRRLQLAKQHIREVRKYARRMLNENLNLQEKLNLLEENKED